MPIKFLGNGKIDFEEFVNMMLVQGEEMAWNDKDMVEAFRAFDCDDKGYFLSAELKYVLTRMDDPDIPDEDVQEMLIASGLTKNRRINLSGK